MYSAVHVVSTCMYVHKRVVNHQPPTSTCLRPVHFSNHGLINRRSVPRANANGNPVRAHAHALWQSILTHPTHACTDVYSVGCSASQTFLCGHDRMEFGESTTPHRLSILVFSFFIRKTPCSVHLLARTQSEPHVPSKHVRGPSSPSLSLFGCPATCRLCCAR